VVLTSGCLARFRAVMTRKRQSADSGSGVDPLAHAGQADQGVGHPSKEDLPSSSHRHAATNGLFGEYRPDNVRSATAQATTEAITS
jgi:hypothetical protein